jgi:alpha-glucosidase
MKAISFILCILFVIPVTGQRYAVNSPDNSIKIEVSVNQAVSFKVSLDDKPLIAPSRVGMQIDKLTSPVWKVKKVSRESVNQVLHPVVPEKSSSIQDNYNELKLQFQNKLALTFRAYDQGIAYRWESAIKDSVKVLSELAQFGFVNSDQTWYPSEKSFYSHNERLYKQYAIIQISEDSLASLPALVNHSGINVLISEADLFDYPGMWLTGNGNDKLVAVYPPCPARERSQGDRNVMVDKTEDYLAKTIGTRTYPWRVFMIGRKDADLLNNQLVYQLSRATSEDFSWVKPGKIAWDWWNALNVYGVDFKSGVNTATYKYFIDFAAKYGLEYIILDEGWSTTTDVTRSVESLDMPELLAYAKEKKVGIIVWVLWNSLDKQMETAMNLYAQWGIKGIKVDFMQRDDQKMVNFYERTAREAAKRKLLVDYHGAFKPTGMERLYPNVITREGVYGLEQAKWDATKGIGPEHNVTLPFIRNAVGPMDYTPGAMINAQAESWAPIFQRPMSLGTRCHQLAMYIVYTSPLQMLSDVPSNYYREPECMEFLQYVPPVWNETVILGGKTGDYVIVARKAANGDWYVGAMTDWTARDIQIDFSFLGNENYLMDSWQDGINADRVGIDFARKTTNITKTAKQNIHLAPGGGWVARIKKL